MSGQSANLTLRAEAGKASLSLTVDVVLPRQVQGNPHARNSPSRQCLRERRVAARGAAAAHETAEEAEHKAAAEDVAGFLPNVAEKASENEASTKQDPTAEANSNVNDAAKASTVQAVFREPSDEIENANISQETKAHKFEENELASILSVIPLKHFDLKDDVINKAIKDKIEAKDFEVKQIDIHRSIRGTFVRSDVLIKPAPVEIIKKMNFQFENCQVIPCYGFR